MTRSQLHRVAAAALVAWAVVSGSNALAQGAKQILNSKNSELALFTDPEASVPHAKKSIAASTVKWPLPVLEQSDFGHVRTMLDLGSGKTSVWLNAQHVKLQNVVNADCLVVADSSGPKGVNRGANETCTRK